jgi:hypothetical protein
LSKNLTQENHIFLIRDGRRYLVTEVEKLVGWTARISFIDTADGKPYGMIQLMSEQFWEDLGKFRQIMQEKNMPGIQFVITMKKNLDGSADISYETVGVRDPADRRYT